ncbi:signal recognition particle protein [Blochmannia endosymbiont of Colobopsis nipponica]|uniref:signal recognition particle protein n=1 Tax=Blochmannia endosymbiont of Colobopsis nipponica TaxID=2681987 RepID=UPI001785E072|nr:signal recognition particle protein [Blochmannia endosymbiont of Colobopsis nipponica]QOI11237.1 signal recognition particle protein [Blochmannia endosymbiont of Colobopsis nipponica]
MFENLSNRLLNSLRKIRSPILLTEDNVKDTLREIRNALLDADVALPVVYNFLKLVKKDAVGKKVSKGFTPSQELIRIIRSSLITAMGGESIDKSLNLFGKELPRVMFLVGLQGVGKTTTIAKLGKFLKSKKDKRVLVVSVDVYRPAGIKQLETLALKGGIDFFPSNLEQKPIDIVNLALDTAKSNSYDVLLVDTPGCLPINRGLISEIVNIHKVIKPVETLFVVDSMIGQDAANIASSFNSLLPLTGIILTKVDGDARGGAAFSVYHITRKPIKFIGVGESINELEPFYPERLVSRLLGMGDIFSLVEDIKDNVDELSAKELVDKVKSGNDFNLIDFTNQLKQLRNIGGIVKIINRLPGVSYLPENIKSKIDDKFFDRMEIVINSMTMRERNEPKIIKGSRKRRIAYGAGVNVQDVNKLLQQFFDMQYMLKKINKFSTSKTLQMLQKNMFSIFGNKR